jgi:hypothetical protein
LDNPQGLYVSGNYVYVGATDLDRLTIIDISNPANPTLAGSYQDSTYLDGPSDVFVVGKYAYVTATLSDRLTIIDISNPANPTFAGSYYDPSNLGVQNIVYVSGRYAYVGVIGPINLITIINISDPYHPSFVTSIIGGDPSDIQISGKYAYFTMSPRTFSIMDISGIDAPVASIGSILSSDTQVFDNMQVSHNLYVRTGINVGGGGIKADGPIIGKNIETFNIIASSTGQSSLFACDVNHQGNIHYNNVDSSLCYCDGSSWLKFDGSGACSN